MVGTVLRKSPPLARSAAFATARFPAGIDDFTGVMPVALPRRRVSEAQEGSEGSDQELRHPRDEGQTMRAAALRLRLGLAGNSADTSTMVEVFSTRLKTLKRGLELRQPAGLRMARISRKRAGYFDSEASLSWAVWLPPEETEASQRPIVQMEPSSGTLDGGRLELQERPAPAWARFGGALSTARQTLKPDGPGRYPIPHFGVAPGDRGQSREA